MGDPTHLLCQEHPSSVRVGEEEPWHVVETRDTSRWTGGGGDLGWSDLNRLLEQAGATAPRQISIPKPIRVTLAIGGLVTFWDSP